MESPRKTDSPIDLEARYGAHNYHPLSVVIEEGHGSWVIDGNGVEYLDCLAAYSALNFGHGYPRLVEAAQEQLTKLTLTSRAFHTELLGPFCESLADMANKEMVLPMNTGAEAVESAIKIARRWGYESKGVAPDAARIVVFHNNFHGRTTTISGFSSDEDSRLGFGPFTPGFDSVPFGDAAAVQSALTDDTVAVLVEPIQGEAGVVIPPKDFLRQLRSLCDDNNVLLVADEIQSGLGRAGSTFACDHDHVQPDMYLLGKALGGGIVPVSAVIGSREVLGVLTPGSHGSTFGGNPLACRLGIEVADILSTGEFQQVSRDSGERFGTALEALNHERIAAIRWRGLWAALDLVPGGLSGRELCDRLLNRRVLAKEAHEYTVRFAPPLNTRAVDLDFAVEMIADALDEP